MIHKSLGTVGNHRLESKNTIESFSVQCGADGEAHVIGHLVGYRLRGWGSDNHKLKYLGTLGNWADSAV